MDVSCPTTSLTTYCGCYSSLYDAYSRLRAYDSPNVKKVAASDLECDDITLVGRGVDIAFLGVDVAILRRQEKGGGLQGEGGKGGLAV